MLLRQTFYNSIYLEFKEKERNSFAVMTWAMFRLTRWLPNGVLKEDLLDLSRHLFRMQEFP